MIHTTDTSAFLNYALGLRNGTKVSAFSEAGVSIAGAFVYASATYTEDGTFVRGLTSITVDDRRRLQRWVAGDRLVSSGLLGSAVVMGGISFSRDFFSSPLALRECEVMA